MTREEAKSQLEACKRIIQGCGHDWLDERDFPVLDLAIEALSDVTNTNAADMISRQAAIDALEKIAGCFPYKVPEDRSTYSQYNEGWSDAICTAESWIENMMPSAEPEIIYCKDCRKHNQGINEAPYLADRCPLILHRGYAQGHEFDYQYCVYAERETDEGHDL